jgi:hypothetical protein
VLVPLTAVALPTVVLLGVFTSARLVDTGVQNVAYLAGIARIRAYYRSLAPHDGNQYFAPWGGREEDEVGQALASLSRSRSWVTGLGTAASMVTAINGVVAGAGVALAVARSSASWTDSNIR